MLVLMIRLPCLLVILFQNMHQIILVCMIKQKMTKETTPTVIPFPHLLLFPVASENRTLTKNIQRDKLEIDTCIPFF